MNLARLVYEHAEPPHQNETVAYLERMAINLAAPVAVPPLTDTAAAAVQVAIAEEGFLVQLLA